MSGKIDISTIINTLIFCGISINFPKVINSLNKDTICLWISVFAFIGLQIYNFNDRIKYLNSKLESFDNKFKNFDGGLKNFDDKFKNIDDKLKYLDNKFEKIENAGLQIYTYDNRIKGLDSKLEIFDNKFKNFDDKFKKVENHDNDINELKVICSILKYLLEIEISKRNE